MEIRRLQERLRITGVYVIHDQAEAMTLCGVTSCRCLGSLIDCDVEVNGQTSAGTVYDPRRKALHREDSPVRLRFIEECTYVLAKDG